MTTFESVHGPDILGKLTHFDRMILRGYLSGLYPKGRFKAFLDSQRVLLKDFSRFVQIQTAALKAHAQRLAEEAGRPFIYLDSPHTHASADSKEAMALRLAERDGIREGLVCVFSTLELCKTFTVHPNRAKCRLEVRRKATKCLHFYFYLIDPEFGWMHIRLQSWFPFEIQIYANGREWLARRLDARGIGHRRYDNTFLAIDDLATAQKLCLKFRNRKLHRPLAALARRVNPLLRDIQDAGFGTYGWCLHQAELATDIMFKDRAALLRILPDLFDHALRTFGAEDVMKFLGRKLHGAFLGEVASDIKRRPEGFRIKHRLQRNSIKMYDKLSVLRVETTINNPREFKIWREVCHRNGERDSGWRPMNKSVANLWRFGDVASQANERYLEALSQAELRGDASARLDELCQSMVRGGVRVSRLNPLSDRDCKIFSAVMNGAHTLNGFRNRDLRDLLFPSSDSSRKSKIRRSARTSRLIAKLRGHGLIARVQRTTLYRVTPFGYRAMSAVLRFKCRDFPTHYNKAA